MVKHVGTCELETKRLILRKFKRDDAVMVFNNWASDEEVTRYVAWPIHHHIATWHTWGHSCLHPQDRPGGPRTS